MNSSDQTRWRSRLLVAMLVLAAWLALFGDKTPSGAAKAQVDAPRAPPAPSSPSARIATPAPAKSDPAVEALIPRERLLQRAADRPARDLFASPPPPPPQVLPAAAAPPPEPPPLPFKFIGKKHEDGVWEVFLLRGESHPLVVGVGTTIDSTWRVEAIEPPTMAIRHLPTGRPQQLAIGDAW